MLASTASTNDEVRRRAEAGARDPLAVIADAQTAGRGRRGRRWHSPAGLGLYLSVLFRTARQAAESARWTLAAAVAACLACRAAGVADAEIDWPNDVLAGGLKLGGTLAEVRAVAGRTAELIVGTGINVGHGRDDFPAELRRRATSLRLAGASLDREALAARYLSGLAGLAARLERGEWAPIASRWSELAPAWRDARVRVSGSGGARWDGRARGLDARGALVVERDDGARVTVHLADSVARIAS